MRPKRYPYSRPRYQKIVINEEYLTFSDRTFQVIELKNAWTGKIVDYRHEVRGG